MNAKHEFAIRSLSNALESDGRYRLKRPRTLVYRILTLMPPAWRERVAERLLRRSGVPGPAAEHVMQNLLSAARQKRGERKRAEATVVKGADNFYERQYRQYLNANMGAFAMTATQVLVASGGARRGRLWRCHRQTYAAVVEQTADASPIVVLDHQTVAVHILLPRPKRQGEHGAVNLWLAGGDPMPEYYRNIVAGDEVRCVDPTVHARLRSADGAILEVAAAAVGSKRLTLLALHPHDPDAMGLHITLFAVEALGPERLERDYGLEPAALDAHRNAALQTGRMLVFFVGGTEEVFTQCAQNLFVKRPGVNPAQRPAELSAWDPRLPLERLLDRQFETIQVTVSGHGLPGASPRNGDLGKAAFVGRRSGSVFVLIPYHPGNAVHGHAAKMWSNPYSTLVISDDHHALCRVMVSGPSRIVDHDQVKRDFPPIAAQVAAQRGHGGKPIPDPEYWFLQEVTELVQQREPLAANILDPARPTCSIAAGGHARHGKKPGYFAADTLPPYDQDLQREREAAGRPIDPTGAKWRRWIEMVGGALDARQAHLARALSRPSEQVVDVSAASGPSQ